MTEKLNWRTIIKAADDTPPDLIAAFDAYFAPFAQPDKDEARCPGCEKSLTGLSAMFLGGGFTWGLVHGEGHCAACHWPARAHHFIKDAKGDDVITLRNYVLAYHPDSVERRATA
jgi:hypothetical protein